MTQKPITEPTQDIGDNGDALTVSYMCGYHKRDDEVRLLKKDNAKLREELEKAFRIIDGLSTSYAESMECYNDSKAWIEEYNKTRAGD